MLGYVNCGVLFEFYCFSVATTPNCTVDKRLAAASEDVTYTCFATPVCGRISITLSIENNGDTVATRSNDVRWTTKGGSVGNSVITCMSTIPCPTVDVFGEFIALYLKSMQCWGVS